MICGSWLASELFISGTHCSHDQPKFLGALLREICRIARATAAQISRRLSLKSVAAAQGCAGHQHHHSNHRFNHPQVKDPTHMLNRFTTSAALALITAANSATAAAPTTPGSNVITSLSHSATCLMFANDPGSVGKAIRRQCAQQEFARQPDRRTLQECIKPGSFIDDDVRNCMKGL